MPVELGGSGLGLDEYSQLMRRLGYVAPATALAVNMHCYWMGVAADLLKAGDDSCRWMLEKAAEGEVFCALHGEAGNDLPLLLVVVIGRAGRRRMGDQRAQDLRQPVAGVDATAGSTRWTRRTRTRRRSCTGSCPARASGYQIVDTWDTLGMRATQSQDTVLDGAFVPDELCPLVCPAGFAGAGPFHLSIFAWALLGFASVYSARPSGRST